MITVGASSTDRGSATNLAPWMITVGASSTDRDFASNIMLGDAINITGESLSLLQMSTSTRIISASEAYAGYFTPYQSRILEQFTLHHFGSSNLSTIASNWRFPSLLFSAAPTSKIEGNRGSATNLAPWMITVGASSTDRDFASNIMLGDAINITGESQAQICNHDNWQLYYKFRSRGILAYSAVFSSTVNSDQQFPNGLQSKVPMFLGGLSVFVCFVVALYPRLALSIVPRQVMPWMMKAYQVGSAFLALNHDYDSGKGLQQQVSSCDIATCYYGLGMAFLAVAARSLPCFLGITALFLRLGLMFALYLS
ncbi:Inositol phosphorylceramide glucuronosyltransferase 1 [Camellia lanceoleosa]|uniref:Inositol phosphorylceramide glucuronosyltransferase 1 n=1 Tax=Camellia lanceoleosa TaxID=1840588 RepID=A0ACC0IEN3_9ERIC|nr:Inositol phosphorylceramide glucuronosyltransferase 1 [Camellia lanceoleosa]